MQRQEISQQQFERIRADIGIDAETFKRTQLGQYILDHCERVAEEHTKQLKRVDPHDEKRIRDLQHEIWKHESFEVFLDEAINSGQAAIHNLQQMEANTDDEANYIEPPRGDRSGDFAEPPELPGE